MGGIIDYACCVTNYYAFSKKIKRYLLNLFIHTNKRRDSLAHALFDTISSSCTKIAEAFEEHPSFINLLEPSESKHIIHTWYSKHTTSTSYHLFAKRGSRFF